MDFGVALTDHDHHNTPNHCCKQVLTGWKQGATGTDGDDRETMMREKMKKGMFSFLFPFCVLVTNKVFLDTNLQF